MESPRRWTLSFIVILLSRSNIAVISQNLTPANSPPALQILNRECGQPNVAPPPQIVNQLPNLPQTFGMYPDLPPGRIVGSENQPVFVLTDGISPPSSINILPFHSVSPLRLQPSPFTSTPQCNTLLPTTMPPVTFPVVSGSLIQSNIGSTPVVPTPALTLSHSLSTPSLPSPELPPINCPQYIPSNSPRLLSLIQQQVSVPDVGQTYILQYCTNSPASPSGSTRIVPLSQMQSFPLDNCAPSQILPEVYSTNYLLPVQDYSCVSQYEPTGAYPIHSTSLLPKDTFYSTVLPDVNIYPPIYQTTTLPSVLTAPRIISEPYVYSSNQYANTQPASFTEDMSNSQLPINLQINMPEFPTPMLSIISPIPTNPNTTPQTALPSGINAIAMGKSKSKWKKLLPAFILALFSNNRGGFGCSSCDNCCCYCSNNVPDNVYIPYPIAIPTNNPIIYKNESSRKDIKSDS